jgi:hypothetical protein
MACTQVGGTGPSTCYLAPPSEPCPPPS